MERVSWCGLRGISTKEVSDRICDGAKVSKATPGAATSKTMKVIGKRTEKY